MMQFQIHPEAVTKHLQLINNIVEKRQTKPILGYFLLQVKDGELVITATDLELEIVVRIPLQGEANGETTVPAKKFTDICRSIPGDQELHFSVKENFAQIKAGSSRFSLNTLPVEDFPALEIQDMTYEYSISLHEMRELLERTHFAMAVQDVRAFLNGLLLELDEDKIRAVATDAHRLALCEKSITRNKGSEKVQIIVPRKGVQELIRLMENVDTNITLSFNNNHLQVQLPDTRFTTKLIDGRYPDYQRVLPEKGNMVLKAKRDEFRQSLMRTAILSSEKYKGVLLKLDKNNLGIHVNNTEQEQAQVEMPVEYDGESFEVGFNISYLLDVMNALKNEDVELTFIDSASSCLILEKDNMQCRYVVMPMRV